MPRHWETIRRGDCPMPHDATLKGSAITMLATLLYHALWYSSKTVQS
jgi:hypothetical protein